MLSFSFFKFFPQNTARDEVQATLDAAEHRIQLLETDAKHADETHRAACAAAQSRADTAEAELAARNVAGEGHAAQQQKARNEVSALRLQLVELRAEVEDLNNACACERDRAERLARKGAADVAALKAELEAAEQRCSVKVGALQQAEAEQRKLAAEVNALRATLKETASYEAQHQVCLVKRSSRSNYSSYCLSTFKVNIGFRGFGGLGVFWGLFL